MDRICKKCGKEYPLKDYEFYILSSGQRHQRNQCKYCRAEHNKQRERKKCARICPECNITKQPVVFVRDNSLDYKAYGTNLYVPYKSIRNENKPVNFVAIPYYTWANRKPGPMTTWIKVSK